MPRLHICRVCDTSTGVGGNSEQRQSVRVYPVSGACRTTADPDTVAPLRFSRGRDALLLLRGRSLEQRVTLERLVL